jgi:ribosomal protein S12 methylthiotransferase accessory factor
MYTGEETLQDRVFAASTNGMASGNTREEAIASGLFEVIERDAMNIALTNEKAKRCRIDTSHDPFTLSAIESARKADCEFFCYDCTSDTGVPVFLCILADKQRGVGLYKGYGCHLCPDIALNRAICEAAQARCVIMAGARDDITWAVHRNVIANTVDIDWVYEFNKQDFSTDLADMSDLSTGSAEHDIQKALAMLDSAGFDRALVVDFPIEDAPFSCVKVLVPGMAGYKFLNGVNPGRVLEVGRNNKQIENQ